MAVSSLEDEGFEVYVVSCRTYGTQHGFSRDAFAYTSGHFRW